MALLGRVMNCIEMDGRQAGGRTRGSEGPLTCYAIEGHPGSPKSFREE